MANTFVIRNKIKPFKKKISVSGDKSLSIRWVLFSSLSSGISIAKNLLMSEDVMAALRAVRKLGVKVSYNKKDRLFRQSLNFLYMLLFICESLRHKHPQLLP